VDPNQINFQVPKGVPAGPSAQVVVTANGSVSAPATVAMADYATGVFGYFRTAQAYDPIVVHSLTNTLVTPSSPAIPGETLVAYATGVGKLNNPPADAVAASASPLATSADTPFVTVGGSAAQVLFAGLTPGLVGVIQINFTLAANLQSGSLPMLIQFPGDSAPTVNLAVAGNIIVSTPSISVNPASLAFGNVTVGQSSTATLTVGNTGTAALNVTVSASAPFSVVSPSAPFTVQPGTATTVTVKFAPTAAGPAPNGSVVTITSNDPAKGQIMVPLSGNGVASSGGTTFNTTLTITGSGTNSGGNISASGTVTLSGIGAGTFSSNFNLASAAVSGSAPLTLTITSGSPTGTLTGALTGSLTLLQQVFAGVPTVSGPATIAISSGTAGFAGATGNFNVTASGTGTGTTGSGGGTFSIAGPGTITIPGSGGGGTPTISTPSGVNFSSAAQGSSKTASLTVKNTGTAPLNVTGVTAGGAFSVGSAQTFTVAPGSSNTVTLQFSPATAGGSTGSVTLASNDPAHPNLTIPVWGTAYVAANVMTSDSFNRANAGECALGTSDLKFGGTTAYQYLPVWPTNSGPAGASIVSGALQNNTLNYGGVQLTSPSSNTCGAVRGASLSQDLDIIVDLYVPTTGSLITDAGPYFRSRAAAPGDGLGNGTSSGYWVELFSTGQVVVTQLNPDQAIAQTAIPAAFDSTIVHTLEAHVQGTALQVTLDGSLLSFNGSTTVTVSTASNSGTAGISFGSERNPSMAGGQTAANLVISSVTSTAPPTLVVPTTPPPFGSVAVGQVATMTINVQNTGSLPLTVNSVSISNPAFGLLSPTIPITVAPQSTTAVTLVFAPTSAGAQSAMMTINSNDPNNPTVSLTLTGTGTGTPTNVLAYSNVVVGQSETGTLSFTNTGTLPLTVTSQTTTNAAFTVTLPSTPYTIPAGQEVAIQVVFKPATYAVYKESLIIVYNGGTVTTALTGAGVAVQ
jgi:uncharacterized protein (TIGR03437 family)